MKRFSLSILALVLLYPVFVIAQGSGSVFDSKHNLSVSGPGEIKSTNESRVCIFCHSSHNASSEGPLWGHQTTSNRSFETYQRSTLDSKPEQPNGVTKLCLSCHDGTVAVGAVSGLRRIEMKGVGSNGAISAARKSNLGHDLTGTHPISIKYDRSTALKDASLRWPPVDPAGEVGVDGEGFVQCTACHDPHDDSKSDRYPFWKKETFDEVCLVCHDM